MTNGLDELEHLPDDLRRRIGAACERLEGALLRGEPGRAEDHVFDAGPGSDVLLRELLLLECEYRQRAGRPVTADELVTRFPGRRELVAGVAELARRYALPGRDGLTLPDGAPAVVGRYRLLRELGRGGFGVVFLAVDPLSDREVAVKVPHAPILLSAELREWFTREGRAAAALDHPHIVRVEDAGEAGLVRFLVSEYVPGPSLAEWLRENAGPARPIPAAAAELTAALAGAVQHAHDRGVLHRDLKPANVLLDGGTLTAPKLTDFGLARLADAPDRTASGQVFGTPAYMAPEQAAGRRREVGVRTDVYGLGAILYELLTGRPPFAGGGPVEVLRRVLTDELEPPRTYAPSVPRELQAVCLRCLEKAPARRYASAAELAADLRRFLAGKRTRARPRGALRRTVRWGRRHSLTGGLAAVVAAAVLVAGVGLLEHNRRLGAVNDQLGAANQRLEGVLDEREASNRALRRTAYAAGIRRADALLDRGEVAAARRTLAEWDPTGGAGDLRGWEWHYLRHRVERYEVARWDAGTVYSLAFSADGRTLAGAGADGATHLWDAATGQDQVPPLRHPGEVDQVVWAPDGRHLATACDDGLVRVWPRAGGPPRALGRHAGKAEAVAFSPDGRTVASAGQDKAVRLWDPAAEGQEPRTCAEGLETARALAFAPGGRALIVGWANHDARAVEAVPRGPTGFTFGGHLSPVVAVRVLPAGDRVVTAGRYEVLVWDWDPVAAAGRLRFRLPRREYWINDVAVGPDGRTLAVAGAGAVRVWDLDGPRLRYQLCGHEGRVWAAAFHPAGRLLATAGADGTVRVWDLGAAAAAEEPLVARGGNRVALLPGPPRVAVLSSELPGVEVWGWTGNRPTRLAAAHGDGLRRLAPTPDGRAVVTQDARGRLVRWEVGAWDGAPPSGPPGMLPRHVLHEPDPVPVVTGLNHSLAVGPGGQRLAAAYEQAVRVIDPVAGGAGLGLAGHRSAVTALAFHPNGTTLASGSGDRVCLWDTATGARVGGTDGLKIGLRALAFAPDGRLAGGGDDQTVRVWDAGGAERLHLVGHRGSVHALAFAPDARTLACGSTDGTVRLWQATSGDELLTFGMTGEVCYAAFSSDGRYLVCAARDAHDLERLTVRHFDCGRPVAGAHGP